MGAGAGPTNSKSFPTLEMAFLIQDALRSASLAASFEDGLLTRTLTRRVKGGYFGPFLSSNSRVAKAWKSWSKADLTAK